MIYELDALFHRLQVFSMGIWSCSSLFYARMSSLLRGLYSQKGGLVGS